MADLKLTYPDLLWAGTEHSFDIAVEAYGRIMAMGAAMPSDEEDDEPYNFKLHGEIGLISIKGSLTNRDSPWNRYYGVTSYNDIRKAVVHAANDPNVKAILLDIDSGGGAVNGVAGTGDLISTIDSQVKPVYAVTDGMMASAAYWLGSSARKVYASRVSVVGSIGVISTHMEYSKALKEAGINVTVLRAGEYKALVNSVEPLTKVAIEQAMAQLGTAYNVFLNHVADRRGVTVDTADKMAQGREFMGEAAVSAGLIDGVMSFDSLLSKISAEALDSPQVTQSQYGRHIQTPHMKTAALTSQQIAAIQAGIDPAQVAATTAAPATPAPAAETTATPAPAAETTAPAAETTAPAAEATTPAAPAESAVVALLSKQLAEAQQANVDLRVQLANTSSQLQSLTAVQAGLKQIVAGSLSTMRVALNLGAVDLNAMSAESLVAEHAAVSGQFTQLFKVGGVAAHSSTETSPAKEQGIAPHLVRATRSA